MSRHSVQRLSDLALSDITSPGECYTLMLIIKAGDVGVSHLFSFFLAQRETRVQKQLIINTTHIKNTGREARGGGGANLIKKVNSLRKVLIDLPQVPRFVNHARVIAKNLFGLANNLCHLQEIDSG